MFINTHNYNIHYYSYQVAIVKKYLNSTFNKNKINI